MLQSNRNTQMQMSYAVATYWRLSMSSFVISSYNTSSRNRIYKRHQLKPLAVFFFTTLFSCCLLVLVIQIKSIVSTQLEITVFLLFSILQFSISVASDGMRVTSPDRGTLWLTYNGTVFYGGTSVQTMQCQMS